MVGGHEAHLAEFEAGHPLWCVYLKFIRSLSSAPWHGGIGYHNKALYNPPIYLLYTSQIYRDPRIAICSAKKRTLLFHYSWATGSM